MNLYLLLITIYLICYAFISWKKTDWALYWLVFSLPSYLIRLSIFKLPTTVLELMIVILFLVWLLKNISGNIKAIKKKIIDFKYLTMAMVLFLIAATASMLLSPDLRTGAGLWKAYFIEPVIFLIVFVNVIDFKKLKNIFFSLGFSAGVVSLIGIYQKISGDLIPNPFWAAATSRRVTGPYPYPNALALYLAPIIVLLLGLMPIIFKNFKKISIKKYLLILVAIISSFSLYFTKSKGGLAGALAGAIFYAVFYRHYKKYFVILIALVIIISFGYIYIFNIDFNIEGMATVPGGGSVSTRINMWSETWAMIKTRPILGAGLSGYQTAVAPFHSRDYIEIYLYPHNIILNFWTETGLLGLISFILILVWFYVSGSQMLSLRRGFAVDKDKKLKSIYVFSLLGSMSALLIHGLVDVPYFKNDLSVLFFVLIAGMVVIYQSNKKELVNRFKK